MSCSTNSDKRYLQRRILQPHARVFFIRSLRTYVALLHLVCSRDLPCLTWTTTQPSEPLAVVFSATIQRCTDCQLHHLKASSYSALALELQQDIEIISHSTKARSLRTWKRWHTQGRSRGNIPIEGRAQRCDSRHMLQGETGFHVQKKKTTATNSFSYLNLKTSTTPLDVTDCDRLLFHSDDHVSIDGRWWLPVHRDRPISLSTPDPAKSSLSTAERIAGQ